MDVRENLVTPRSGQPLITATQDFLTAAFVMTQREVFLTRDQFCWAASYLDALGPPVTIPEPAVLKPVPLWTGKQLFSLLLCPNDQDAIRVNLQLKVRYWLPSCCCRCHG